MHNQTIPSEQLEQRINLATLDNPTSTFEKLELYKFMKSLNITYFENWIKQNEHLDNTNPNAWVNSADFTSKIKFMKENNIERKKINRKSYSERNKDKEKSYSYYYFKERYENDLKFKLFHNLRTRIYKSIKNRSNSSKELLGCTIDEYYTYIENQFDNYMTWNNYGTYWEIDHIIPINTFDLSIKEHCIEAFNYKNTRPLSCLENSTRPKDGKDLFGKAK